MPLISSLGQDRIELHPLDMESPRGSPQLFVGLWAWEPMSNPVLCWRKQLFGGDQGPSSLCVPQGSLEEACVAWKFVLS